MTAATAATPVSPSTDEAIPAITCMSIRKEYGGAVALRDVTVTVKKGSIHALVGENGAGKSTLLGVMSGRVRADRGTVHILGAESQGGDPRKSRSLGLVTVYQELTMVPSLAAMANVFLGQAWTRGGVLRTSAMRERYEELCAEFEISIPADTRAEHLSVSSQQMLEILRGVQSDASVILLDEPTAALAEHERASLYRVLLKLKERGTTIVLVSHNLGEVFALCDTITVMRNGELIRTDARDAWTRSTLIEAMVGRNVEKVEAPTSERSPEIALEVRDARPRKDSPGIDVSVHRGEIVGMWGLVGSGRTSFLRSLAGALRGSTGTMCRDGAQVDWPATVRAAQRQGVVMVPESRKQALVMTMSGRDNFWLGRQDSRSPLISRPREHEGARTYGDFFAFNTARMGEPVRNLSGGNQQKVLLAKAAGRAPGVFLIDEPTRGIDVGAKAEVLQSLVRLASDGASILVTSSELEEVLSISSRILVFAHGAVVKEIQRGDPDFNLDDIVKLGFTDGSDQE